MLKIGLIGFGFMGRMHFDNYVRLTEEGHPIALKAICDLRIEELKDGKADGNMSTAREVYDLTAYSLYDDLEKMIANEELDMIDIAVPTYLHAEMACSLLERGYHVFCEKPMARTSVEAQKMVEAAERSGKKLMIGQCLRFWPGYEYLKEVVETEQFGKVTEGYFYRGSGAPKDWFLDEKLSGGCIVDMHIHDTDMINYLFGRPDKVSTLGRNVLPGSGYDIASTHYFYKDAKVINAQVDWTLEGDFGFYMGYRVNFERGNVVFDGSGVKVNPNDGAGFTVELSPDAGYYRELVYFLDAIIQDKPIIICTPESAADSLEIIEAEVQSANAEGEWIVLN
ncbi:MULTISPECIES: Gfo/Idh/MocA family protein [unclassified Paenibacillus]|uniref:Gfo/Idh/MocA family protein n=1 Tax=unclassified Paenibacillus TaxID=185978 RepID=UPI0004F8CAB5|nr:Gfo/Idh/MocA family oxidoreductase [Paenibacillus sp. FSL H7-0737]AIQ25373.1 oxidoreductase [Paenibacillus sp. FSL H7-0737]